MKKLLDLFFTFIIPPTEIKTIEAVKKQTRAKKPVVKKNVITKQVVQKKPKTSTKKNKSKKDEVLEGLEYLKTKKNKTKKDRESIYMLEMVLKNME